MAHTPPKPFPYRLNHKLRELFRFLLALVTARADAHRPSLENSHVTRILIVRASFRMGDSLLAAPAVAAFRSKYPDARIDFVGAPIAAALFAELPLDNIYTLTRSFPGASLHYPRLLRRLHAAAYDLAVDVSCSQSAMGSFLVGFSGALVRIGRSGRWDRWFNVRIEKTRLVNKYETLPDFLERAGLEPRALSPWLALRGDEIEASRQTLRSSIPWHAGAPLVGIFVGGRKAWGKRWPATHFCDVAAALRSTGLNVAVFIGPEERDVAEHYRAALEPDIPVVHEASPRRFAGLVKSCDLFVTCDSGPMHLAYAVGTRTVAIFQQPGFNRWAPPATHVRVVHRAEGCSPDVVLQAGGEELHRLGFDAAEAAVPAAAVPEVRRTRQRLGCSLEHRRLVGIRRYAQLGFVVLAAAAAWTVPGTVFWQEETFADELVDLLGFGSLTVASLLHLWTISHSGVNGAAPIFTGQPPGGPYAYVRYPLYLANLLMGVGILLLAPAIPTILLLLVLVAWHLRVVIPAEDRLGEMRFGAAFQRYCAEVPRFFPRAMPQRPAFGAHLPFREFSVLWVLAVIAFAMEWIESPLHRQLVMTLYDTLRH